MDASPERGPPGMDSVAPEDNSIAENVSTSRTLRSSPTADEVARKLEDGTLALDQGRQSEADEIASRTSSTASTVSWNRAWRKQHHHLWTSKKLPHRSTQAHTLARAEAASWAQMTPLIAATLGPLSLLLGIPSLSQPWSGVLLDPPTLAMGASNFTPLPDPALNLGLAAASIFCEASGNALLILRFSNFHTRLTTWLSYGFWIAKMCFGLANMIEFGVTHPQTDTVIYLQGFWIGVCSLCVTLVILVALTYNLAFLHKQEPLETRRLHHVQREFMGQTIFFFFFVGICALIFCKIEDVTYVDGIYFIVVTTLTIGFGDIVPTTTAMKVLTFPIAILGISLLAVIVTSILRLLDDRDRRQLFERRSRLRKEQAAKEKKHVEEIEKVNSGMAVVKPPLSLQEELQSLRDKDWKRERHLNIQHMVIGLAVFLLFWYIGALIFHLVEPWSYGNALYFCYIFFLTIGYGDFYPASEAGRPIFIIYALLAVPTMTVVIQTFNSNLSSLMNERVHHQRHRVYQEKQFIVQSLTSLVKEAKRKACETMDQCANMHLEPRPPPVELPLHEVTERVMENLMEGLQQMHYLLGNILMQKLGRDAGHLIHVERQRAKDKGLFKEGFKKAAEQEKRNLGAHTVPEHLRELGQNSSAHDLELLNEYREHYAHTIAELLIAKELLVDFERGLQSSSQDAELRSQAMEDLDELAEMDFVADGNKHGRRRSSEW